jgi:hypothetical protein
MECAAPHPTPIGGRNSVPKLVVITSDRLAGTTGTAGLPRPRSSKAFAAVTRALILAVLGDLDQRPQRRHGVLPRKVPDFTLSSRSPAGVTALPLHEWPSSRHSLISAVLNERPGHIMITAKLIR